MEVAELNDILSKSIGKTVELIQEDFNKKIYLVDENSKEVESYKDNKDKQKL